MYAESGMTLKSQIAVAIFVILCISMIIRLLQKRKITESLFYFWLIVFIGVLIVGMSHTIQNILTRLIGSYSPLSTMLFLALCFLFGVSMVYSVLLSGLSTRIRDITAYVAEMKLDVEELGGRRFRDSNGRLIRRTNPYEAIAKRVEVTVEQLMRGGDNVPTVGLGTTVKDALSEIADKRVGRTGVVDDEGRLIGVVTDEDLKRVLLERPHALEIPVRDLMAPQPETISASAPAADALRAMEMGAPEPMKMLFVIDTKGRPIGVIHVHDILKVGLNGA